MVDLAVLKNARTISINDYEQDALLERTLRRATRIICEYAHIKDASELEESDEEYILDCCRYILDDSFEKFEENFRDELLGLKIKYEVKAAYNAKLENQEETV